MIVNIIPVSMLALGLINGYFTTLAIMLSCSHIFESSINSLKEERIYIGSS
jgi:hypothetical protein